MGSLSEFSSVNSIPTSSLEGGEGGNVRLGQEQTSSPSIFVYGSHFPVKTFSSASTFPVSSILLIPVFSNLPISGKLCSSIHRSTQAVLDKKSRSQPSAPQSRPNLVRCRLSTFPASELPSLPAARILSYQLPKTRTLQGDPPLPLLFLLSLSL